MMNISKLASYDDNKYVNILEIYDDKSFIYSILCVETARYYNVLKYSFQLPIILSSSILSILNGSTQNESIIKNMPLINTVFNIFTALILSINNVFKWEAKSNDFRNSSIKFQKLNHMIQSKVLEGTNYNQDFINSVMNTYDNIVESIDDDVPSHILKKIQSQYETKKHLPTIINNGVERKMSISSPKTPKSSSPFKRLSTITLNIPKYVEDNTKISPRVLEVKPFVPNDL